MWLIKGEVLEQDDLEEPVVKLDSSEYPQFTSLFEHRDLKKYFHVSPSNYPPLQADHTVLLLVPKQRSYR